MEFTMVKTIRRLFSMLFYWLALYGRQAVVDQSDPEQDEDLPDDYETPETGGRSD
jgi:hypothetical protein